MQPTRRQAAKSPTRRGSWRLSTRSVASSESNSSAATGAAPVSNSSTVTLTNSYGSTDGSCDPTKEDIPETRPGLTTTTKRPECSKNSPTKSVDLAAYYTFSRKNSRVIHDDSRGLSGFLEYRKLNGTWRPFLFQTIGPQLVLYRVHSTHQVLVMSTDIRNASEIALDCEECKLGEDSRQLRLGVNNTTITLRAVTHRAAAYWVDGLQRLRDGKPLHIASDPPCSESEDEIFNEIDKLTSLREWVPPPPTPSLCGLCISKTKLQPPTAGMLLRNKKVSLDEAAPPGCKIC